MSPERNLSAAILIAVGIGTVVKEIDAIRVQGITVVDRVVVTADAAQDGGAVIVAGRIRPGEHATLVLLKILVAESPAPLFEVDDADVPAASTPLSPAKWASMPQEPGRGTPDGQRSPAS